MSENEAQTEKHRFEAKTAVSEGGYPPSRRRRVPVDTSKAVFGNPIAAPTPVDDRIGKCGVMIDIGMILFSSKHVDEDHVRSNVRPDVSRVEIGAPFIFLSILRIRKQKRVDGVNWMHPTFFTAWGIWNLWYYPHLGQWASFAGGILIVIANAVWVCQLIYYSRTRKAV